LKNTEKDHPDYVSLTQLKDNMDLFIAQASRATPKYDEAQKVLLLQATIESDKVGWSDFFLIIISFLSFFFPSRFWQPLKLVGSKRNFIHDGIVQKHEMMGKKELYLVLFSDMLLLCRPADHNKSRFRLKETITTDLFMALDSEDPGLAHAFTFSSFNGGHSHSFG